MGEPATGRTASGNLVIGIAVCLGYAASGLVYDALPPILPALSAHFGGGEHGDFLAQMASTIPVFGIALSGVAAGTIIERLGIRTTLAASLLIFAMTGSLGLVLDGPASLLASRLLVGVATGMMITCGTSLIAANYSGQARATMTGRAIATASISAIGFVLIAGAAAKLGWRAPFALHGLFGLIFIIPIMLLRPAAAIPLREKDDSSHGLRHLRPALPAYLLIVSLMLVSNLFNVQLAFLLRAIDVTDPGVISTVFAAYSGTVALTSLGYGQIEKRLGIAGSACCGLTLIAVGALSCALSGTASLLFAAALLSGIGYGIVAPTNLRLVMRLVDPAHTPRALGLATTVMYLTSAAAPFVYAPIRSLFGLRGQYHLTAAIILAGVLLYGAAAARKRSATATA